MNQKHRVVPQKVSTPTNLNTTPPNHSDRSILATGANAFVSQFRRNRAEWVTSEVRYAKPKGPVLAHNVVSHLLHRG
jgi:hypothetical protein